MISIVNDWFQILRQLTRTAFVVYHISIVPLNAEIDNCEVFWDSLSPLVLGNDIQLMCWAIGKKCSGTFQWDGGPQNHYITFDNSVRDLSKYSLDRRTNGKYILTIKNLSETDLNVTYICHRGFYNFEDVLCNQTYSLRIDGPLKLHKDANLVANTSVSGSLSVDGIWISKPFSSTIEEPIKIGGRFSVTRDDTGHKLHIKSLIKDDLNKTYKFVFRSRVFSKDLSESLLLEEKTGESRWQTIVIVGISVGAVVTAIFLLFKMKHTKLGSCKDGNICNKDKNSEEHLQQEQNLRE